MEILSTQFLLALGSIILLDLVLAGDNAVVIAMASRKLPENMRKRAIYIGTAGAVVIRAIMTLIAHINNVSYQFYQTFYFFFSNIRCQRKTDTRCSFGHSGRTHRQRIKTFTLQEIGL